MYVLLLILCKFDGVRVSDNIIFVASAASGPPSYVIIIKTFCQLPTNCEDDTCGIVAILSISLTKWYVRFVFYNHTYVRSLFIIIVVCLLQ